MGRFPDHDELIAHNRWLRRLAVALTRDDSGADDLVQETWLVALERPPREGRNFRAWLRSVLRRRKAQGQRTERRRERRERRAARRERETPSVEEIAERAELQRRIVALVLALDRPSRDVVLLRFFEELSPAEIARVVGAPVATVHTRLRRALEKLREALDRRHGGERSAWAAVLLPTGRCAGPIEAGHDGPTGATSGCVAASGAGVVVGSTIGGAIVTLKQVTIAVSVAALVVLGVAGWMFAPRGPERPVESRRPAPASPRPEADAVAASAELPGGAESILVPAASEERAPDSDLEPRVETGDIRGRVTSRDGTPVAAARVLACRVVEPDYRNEETAIEGEAETDDEGEFELSELAVGAYVLRAIALEHRPGEVRDLELEADTVLEVDLELGGGLAISGAVVTPDGVPLPGAEVTSTVAPSRPGLWILQPRSDPVGWAGAELAVVTDAAGSFRLTRLPSGNRRLVVRHPEWAPTEHGPVAAGSEGVRITVHAGGALRGTLVDVSSAPVAGAEVRVAWQREQAWHETLKTGARLITDERGSFSAARLGTGRFRLAVRAEGFPPLESEELELAEGATIDGIELVLAEPAALRGMVADESGTPVANAAVEATRITGRRATSKASTDAEGRFVLAELEAGAEYRLEIEHAEFTGSRLDPVVVPPGETDLGHLVLEAGCRLTGDVLDPEDLPLARAEVVLEQHMGEHWVGGATKTLTERDGSFEFRGLDPADYRVRASLPGFAPAHSEAVALAVGEEAELRVLLGGGLSLSGRAVDDQRRPVAGARVTARNGFREAHDLTDADGEFLIHGLEPAEHEVKASLRDLASRTIAGVWPGTRVEVTLERTARISGRVVDAATGAPVTEFSLYHETRERRSAGDGLRFANPDGLFVLDDVQPRWYLLRVRAGGYVLHESRLELASGERRELDIALRRGETISGRVTDVSGAPVAGAGVFPIRPEEVGEAIRRRGGGFYSASGSDGLGYGETWKSPWADEVPSDDAGGFTFSGAEPGTVLLRVEHPDFLFHDLPAIEVRAGPPLDLGAVRLERGSAIEGSLVDAMGGAVHPGSVMVERLREDGKDTAGIGTTLQVGEDGGFAKTGLRSGSYRLSVIGGSVERVVELAADETAHVELRLAARGE